ncbi:hypothetical protein GFS60_02196 [Rhodococcus sp. WAY2]|nr:hypothetical protein GFS60_02196 [Rhodococcus sp. WAY2]
MTGATLTVGRGTIVATGAGGRGAAAGGNVVVGAGSVVTGIARGVVRSAICHVGVGGTKTW